MSEQLDRIESKLDFLIGLITDEEEGLELPEDSSLDDALIDIQGRDTL